MWDFKELKVSSRKLTIAILNQAFEILNQAIFREIHLSNRLIIQVGKVKWQITNSSMIPSESRVRRRLKKRRHKTALRASRRRASSSGGV